MQKLNQQPYKTNSDKPSMSKVDAVKGIKAGLQTLFLTSAGTAVLIGTHHLGRKQQNAHVRLQDYSDGLIERLKNLHACESTDKRTSENSNTTCKSQTDTIDSSTALALSNEPVQWLSGVADLHANKFAVVGIDANRQVVWQTTLAERLHDIVIQPLSSKDTCTPNISKTSKSVQVTAMGRRPSECFWVLDSHSGEVLYRIIAKPNRHFYGHACYSLDGSRLYVTENDTVSLQGKIGVYDATQNYQKIDEFDSQGIGPHELLMHPDGDTLVVANGGIKTERASRQELNLDSMQPSLVYINRHDGRVLERVEPEHSQMSVRHLAMHADGRVVIGIQFQGERHLSIPLVLTHKRGEPQFTALQIPKASTHTDGSGIVNNDAGWHRFHHYIASVAVDSQNNSVCVTSPIGGCAAIFDLDTGFMQGEVAIADCAGVAIYPPDKVSSTTHSQSDSDSDLEALDLEALDAHISRFLVTDGKGGLTRISWQSLPRADSIDISTDNGLIETHTLSQPLAFDNHLKPIADRVS